MAMKRNAVSFGMPNLTFFEGDEMHKLYRFPKNL